MKSGREWRLRRLPLADASFLRFLGGRDGDGVLGGARRGASLLRGDAAGARFALLLAAPGVDADAGCAASTTMRWMRAPTAWHDRGGGLDVVPGALAGWGAGRTDSGSRCAPGPGAYSSHAAGVARIQALGALEPGSALHGRAWPARRARDRRQDQGRGLLSCGDWCRPPASLLCRGRCPLAV